MVTISFTAFLGDRRKSYVVDDVVTTAPKKSTRRKTFGKTEIKKYFGMDMDDCGGLFKGYVYLEIRGKNFKLYRLKKGYDGMEDYESSWKVICETTDKNEVMKHLMVYGDYETYDWWKPFDCSSAWNVLDNVVSEYALA